MFPVIITYEKSTNNDFLNECFSKILINYVYIIDIIWSHFILFK